MLRTMACIAVFCIALVPTPVAPQDPDLEPDVASFKLLDRNMDGVVTSEEWADAGARVENLPSFDTVDADADGRLSEGQWDAYLATKPEPAPSLKRAM